MEWLNLEVDLHNNTSNNPTTRIKLTKHTDLWTDNKYTQENKSKVLKRWGFHGLDWRWWSEQSVDQVDLEGIWDDVMGRVIVVMEGKGSLNRWDEEVAKWKIWQLFWRSIWEKWWVEMHGWRLISDAAWLSGWSSNTSQIDIHQSETSSINWLSWTNRLFFDEWWLFLAWVFNPYWLGRSDGEGFFFFFWNCCYYCWYYCCYYCWWCWGESPLTRRQEKREVFTDCTIFGTLMDKWNKIDQAIQFSIRPYQILKEMHVQKEGEGRGWFLLSICHPSPSPPQ